MRRFILQIGVPLLLVGIATSAEAQQHGNVVYLAPAHGSGLSLTFDYAKGLNDASLKTNYIGGRATFGVSRLVISAGAGSLSFDGPLSGDAESAISWGGNASVDVIKLAGILGLGVFVGYGSLSEDGFKTTSIPFGATISVAPASEGTSFEIWSGVGGRNLSFTVGDGETVFAISGGLNVRLLMGLGFQLAIDVVSEGGGTASHLGLGASYLFRMPG